MMIKSTVEQPFHFIIGNTVKTVPREILESTNNNKPVFQWRLFVEAYDNTDAYFQMLERVVSKVTFHLDSSFVHDKIQVREPPFSIERIGFREFTAHVEITFINDQTCNYSHHLSLDTSNIVDQENDLALFTTKHSIPIAPFMVLYPTQLERNYEPIPSNLSSLLPTFNNNNHSNHSHGVKRIRVKGIYHSFEIDLKSGNIQFKSERDSKHAAILLDDGTQLFLGIYYTTAGNRPLFERCCLQGQRVEVCGLVHECIPPQITFSTVKAPYLTVEDIYPVDC